MYEVAGGVEDPFEDGGALTGGAVDKLEVEEVDGGGCSGGLRFVGCWSILSSLPETCFEKRGKEAPEGKRKL